LGLNIAFNAGILSCFRKSFTHLTLCRKIIYGNNVNNMSCTPLKENKNGGEKMEQSSIKVNGMNIHYKHSGSGQCMVLLHGIPTHSGLWDEVMPHLDQYSVYAFDLLGFGESDKPGSSDIDIKSQAFFLLSVFKALSIKNAVIIGHDIGGGIAQYIAVSNPEAVKAMVLMDSVCYDSWPIELLSVKGKVQMLFEHLPENVLDGLFVKYIEDGLYNKDRAKQISQKYWKYIKDSSGIKSFLNAVESFDSKYTMEIAPLLRTIKTPTLVLWGKHDAYLRLSYAYRLSEDIKNSRIEVIEDGGHFLPEDQPEETAKSIDRFIKDLGTV
jgi:pimeloyl-ACP methyl ester carboxylesterase